MPSRAFHHKDRHGCINCKEGRKRCDQLKPTCGRCARRRSRCTYSKDSSTTNPSHSSNPVILPRTPSTPWNALNPLFQAVMCAQVRHVEMNDLELIHHCSVTDSAAFTTIPGLFPVLRINIAEKAPNYPYLLHGILAVSALHLKSTTANIPESNRLFYARKAEIHRQMALSSYISTLNSINHKTCHSVFAFSAILAGLGFGFMSWSEQDGHADADTYIDNIVSIFDLLLGAVAVANAASAWIEKCRSEPLVLPIRATLQRVDSRIEVEVQHALENLIPGIQGAQVTEIERDTQFANIDIEVIYSSAIPELHNAFRCLGRTEPDKFIGVIGWPAFVKNSYVSLLKQRHPAALVVLAYYGVTLHALDHAWWLRGVGSNLVKSVAAIVGTRHGTEWQDLLQWPLNRIGSPDQNSNLITIAGAPPSTSDGSRTPKSTPPFDIAFGYTYANDFAEP